MKIWNIKKSIITSENDHNFTFMYLYIYGPSDFFYSCQNKCIHTLFYEISINLKT